MDKSVVTESQSWLQLGGEVAEWNSQTRPGEISNNSCYIRYDLTIKVFLLFVLMFFGIEGVKGVAQYRNCKQSELEWETKNLMKRAPEQVRADEAAVAAGNPAPNPPIIPPPNGENAAREDNQPPN